MTPSSSSMSIQFDTFWLSAIWLGGGWDGRISMSESLSEEECRARLFDGEEVDMD